MQDKMIMHGTTTGYRDGCRCGYCRAAKRLANRDRHGDRSLPRCLFCGKHVQPVFDLRLPRLAVVACEACRDYLASLSRRWHGLRVAA